MAADLPASSTVTLPPLHAHIPAEAELAHLVGPTAEHLSLEDQLRLAGVTLRMLNLPFVVCASASGLPFFLTLNKVGCASAHLSSVFWPACACPPSPEWFAQLPGGCCLLLKRAGPACTSSCSNLVGSLGWHCGLRCLPCFPPLTRQGPCQWRASTWAAFSMETIF